MTAKFWALEPLENPASGTIYHHCISTRPLKKMGCRRWFFSIGGILTIWGGWFRKWKLHVWHLNSSYIIWVVPLPSNSQHKDYYTLSRESLQTFICHCYWEGGVLNILVKFSQSLQVGQKITHVWNEGTRWAPTSCKLGYNSIYSGCNPIYN